jgi:hypothetical protein
MCAPMFKVAANIRRRPNGWKKKQRGSPSPPIPSTYSD